MKIKKNNFFLTFTTVIDYILIILKILLFFQTLIHFTKVDLWKEKEIYKVLLYATGSYALVNTFRIFFRKKINLLILEILLNIVFIFLLSFKLELRLLIATITSLLIVLYPSKFKILGVKNE